MNGGDAIQHIVIAAIGQAGILWTQLLVLAFTLAARRLAFAAADFATDAAEPTVELPRAEPRPAPARGAVAPVRARRRATAGERDTH